MKSFATIKITKLIIATEISLYQIIFGSYIVIFETETSNVNVDGQICISPFTIPLAYWVYQRCSIQHRLKLHDYFGVIFEVNSFLGIFCTKTHFQVKLFLNADRVGICLLYSVLFSKQFKLLFQISLLFSSAKYKYKQSETNTHKKRAQDLGRGNLTPKETQRAFLVVHACGHCDNTQK